MRAIRLKGGLEAMLTGAGEWVCAAKPLQNELNQQAARLREDLCPADGNPLVMILQAGAKLVGAAEVIDDEPPTKPLEGAVY